MPTNNFLPWCPANTGTNLPTQGDYSASALRTDGNQPGVASSSYNNKALRQSTYIASQLAQFLANITATDVLDDNAPARLLAQMSAALTALPPQLGQKTSSSGTENMPYAFFIASGNATAAATYTNNAVTFTVKATIATGTLVYMTGNGDPSLSGTLTKASGTGDATLTFYAYRKPTLLEVELVGAGGGGSGSSTGGGGAGNGGAGGNTTWGSLAAGGGAGGTFTAPSGGAGGATTGAAGFSGALNAGAQGGPTQYTDASTAQLGGGGGGGNAYCGNGGGGGGYGSAPPATAAPGQGGGGAGTDAVNNTFTGNGGGGGAYLRVRNQAPASTYAWSVGAGGTAGGAGAGRAGAAGFAGIINFAWYYQ